jgi:hypothetical protein
LEVARVEALVVGVVTPCATSLFVCIGEHDDSL